MRSLGIDTCHLGVQLPALRSDDDEAAPAFVEELWVASQYFFEDVIDFHYYQAPNSFGDPGHKWICDVAHAPLTRFLGAPPRELMELCGGTAGVN